MPDENTGSSPKFAVQIREVRRVFDQGVVAVESCSIDVRRGEFVALLGPSGCGKSTLLRMIAGLDSPSGGTIRRADESIAYVFQDAHLLPWRSVLGNVELPLEFRSVDPRERRERAARALADVGLADALTRYPAQLSGGMKMRASLARALVTDPHLLLLDEPFAALDEITRSRLDEQLRSLWLSRQMTVVFVTHSIAEATFLAERAIVLSRRPARVVLDRKIELPRERTAALRTDDQFTREMRALHSAFDQGAV